MNDETVPVSTQDKPSEEGRSNVLPGPPADWFLQTLVSMVNDNDMEISATLFLGGSIVSGLLISGNKYFAIFGDEFSDSFPGLDPESKKTMSDSFARHGAIYTDPELKSDELPNYVHMRDAHTYTGESEVPQNRGVLWRGRLSEVGGFWLGIMSREKPGGA